MSYTYFSIKIFTYHTTFYNLRNDDDDTYFISYTINIFPGTIKRVIVFTNLHVSDWARTLFAEENENFFDT